jgi:hypothetical protein
MCAAFRSRAIEQGATEREPTLVEKMSKQNAKQKNICKIGLPAAEIKGESPFLNNVDMATTYCCTA